MSPYVEEEAPASESGLEWEEIETPPDLEELIILCLDTSLSMGAQQFPNQPNWSRSQEMVKHIFHETEGLYTRLATSKMRQRYWTAVLVFSDTVEEVFPIKKLITRDGQGFHRPDIRSNAAAAILFGHRRGTAVGGALVAAERLARAWLNASTPLPRMATIAIVSDGKPIGDTVDAVVEANRINAHEQANRQFKRLPRQQLIIATAAYGHGDATNADWSTLRQMASEPESRFYAEPANGFQLRKFLEATILLGRS